jgi:hypothetical protein
MKHEIRIAKTEFSDYAFVFLNETQSFYLNSNGITYYFKNNQLINWYIPLQITKIKL